MNCYRSILPVIIFCKAMHHKGKILVILTSLVTFYLLLFWMPNFDQKYRVLQTSNISVIGTRENWRGLSEAEIKRLSALGRLLYLDEEPPNYKNVSEQYYQILIWKYWDRLDDRHIFNYGMEEVDPFADCSVSNCALVHEDKYLHTADLVIFHMQLISPRFLPRNHPDGQIWAFLTDEAPYHTFQTMAQLKDFNGMFNWSMTYRMDSDIPVPYGRTIKRKLPLSDQKFEYNKRRDVLVAGLMSNCNAENHRLHYVRELNKYIKIDMYGLCGSKNTCPGSYMQDCPDIDNYMFYLAFENSNCRDYITEKLWWNAYEKNSIPIVMGSNQENYKKLLPPNSYINVADFDSPQDLANYLLHLNQTGKYQDLYQWKRNYIAKNEHGFFQSRSYHYCRACEALNYNKRKVQTYHNLEKFWSVDTDCFPDWTLSKTE